MYNEDFITEVVSLYKKLLINIREMKLSKNDKEITHQHILSHSTYSPWADDVDFVKIFSIIQDYTLVDIYRCYELWSFIKKNSHLEGDILEVGVWRGGTGCLMAKSSELFSTSKVVLADTFTGVVKTTEQDTIYKGGEHSDTSVELVHSLINKLNLQNVKILEGLFPDDIDLRDTGSTEIKLCHIDVDTYKSAKDIFYYIWPLIIKGGVVIFDDYGFWGCEGVTKLCNEISENNGTFIYNVNGHGIFIKF